MQLPRAYWKKQSRRHTVGEYSPRLPGFQYRSRTLSLNNNCCRHHVITMSNLAIVAREHITSELRRLASPYSHVDHVTKPNQGQTPDQYSFAYIEQRRVRQ